MKPLLLPHRTPRVVWVLFFALAAWLPVLASGMWLHQRLSELGPFLRAGGF